MRLTPILIQEGRKEDLRKKYTEKFKEYPETLDFIFGISDLADTNFKYADFVLRELSPNDDVDEIEEVVELVKDFDRFKQSLEVKDINQYDLDGLRMAIKKHTESSKSQSNKFDPSDVKKIYEDVNVLIVRPLTHKASCKYGSGTRWCTTTRDEPSYFNNFTANNSALYYVILKKFNADNKFYKMAIHMSPISETWYDATDERMSDREQDVFSLGAPKVIQTIKDDYSTFLYDNTVGIIKRLFDYNKSYEFINVSKSFGRINHKVGLEFYHPDVIPDMPKHATMELNISVDEENIDQYTILIVFDAAGSLITFDFNFTGDNHEIEPEFDFDIENLHFNRAYGRKSFDMSTENGIKEFFNDMCSNIAHRVVYKMKKNTDFLKFLHDGKSVWVPNRMSYGYTFKRKDSGLIKKLVDYLDSSKKGTKLDFLEYIGALEKKSLNGKPFYSRTGQNDWHAPSKWRGQLSGFFNSAKLDGILDYDKQGNSFILKKGPNFEIYKSGELRAL